MSDFNFADGSEIQVAVHDDRVSVYQGSGGTQGRGAAFMSPDEAEQLARGIYDASQEARDAVKPAAAEVAAPAPAVAAVSEAPAAAVAPGLTAEDIVRLVNGVLDAREVKAAEVPAFLPLGANPLPVPEMPVNPSPVEPKPAE